MAAVQVEGSTGSPDGTVVRGRSLLIGASGGAAEQAGRARPAACDKAALTETPFVVKHELGSVRGIAYLGPGGPFPAIVVNCGCYTSLTETVKKEAPLYATRGYAYVLVWNDGPREEVADRVFERWAGDAAAVLDWVGAQAWCNGRAGTHGISLMGSTAYAAVQASLAPGAPSTRPRVLAAAPSLSFSRIYPTVYLFGHGLAVELVMRFLWLAEVGVREGALKGWAYAKAMVGFFGLHDMPGLWDASLRRPLTTADEAMWSRRNVLWQGGVHSRGEADPFWTEGRDVLCDLGALGASCPRLRIVSGWWDIFLQQALVDFAAARAAAGSGRGPRLVVYAGGHFGVGASKGKDIAVDTLAWYDEHLLGLEERGTGDSFRSPVCLQVYGAQAPGDFLEFDAWPPPPVASIVLFARPGEQSAPSGTCATPRGGRRPRLAALSTAPPCPGDQLALQYVYDPRDPTPYVGGGWLNLRKDGPKEQRGVEKRSDVLVLTSEPFTETFDICGVVKASLHVACSARECDVLARLCVCRAPRGLDHLDFRARAMGLPLGKSYNLCETVVRVRFRQGEPAHVVMDVGPTCCRVHVGDRIRLQVCSSAHPRVMRHPLHLDGRDWLQDCELGPPASVELVSDCRRPSSVELPVRPPPADRPPSPPPSPAPAPCREASNPLLQS